MFKSHAMAHLSPQRTIETTVFSENKKPDESEDDNGILHSCRHSSRLSTASRGLAFFVIVFSTDWQHINAEQNYKIFFSLSTFWRKITVTSVPYVGLLVLVVGGSVVVSLGAGKPRCRGWRVPPTNSKCIDKIASSMYLNTWTFYQKCQCY